ncbi:ImuA family protein [Azospirillum picis]|uniref:Protein ImuA n=1 Tax=Azospirillum picis TaxID=488438 RepID=A0ABU0MKR5_9PROT|nr:hypothetical protein [Azospirillum picis]MBP2299928.1 protein ImuA [Azospirillum picis]MDQ0533834.1 protein ImuA [Azospirillum picis]
MGEYGMAVAAGSRADRLAELRARIRRMEGAGGEGGRILPFGVEEIDGQLPDGGLPLGCLHALAAEDAGAGTAFAAALLARMASARAPVLWILRGRDLHAPGLAAYGLTPDRLIAVRAARPADALWAMEEALRCSALSAVLGEVEGLDLTAGRRLQLAAESSGVTGLLLDLAPTRRRDGRAAGGRAGRQAGGQADGMSAAVTRWRLDAVPSRDEEEDAAPRPGGGPPGLGAPRWSVALERCRGGRPGCWTLSWEQGTWHQVERRQAERLQAEEWQAGSTGDGSAGDRRDHPERSGAWAVSDNRQGRPPILTDSGRREAVQ